MKPSVPILMDDSTKNLIKVPNTLVILRQDGRCLIFHCMESGKKLQEFELFGQEFDDVVVHDEDHLIYVTSHTENLAFSYPPLKLLYRVIIPLDVWTGLEGFEWLGGIAFASSKNREVALYDNQQLMDMNMDIDDDKQSTRTFILRNKPEPLTTLKTKKCYFVFLPSFPPRVIVQRGRGVEEVLLIIYACV